MSQTRRQRILIGILDTLPALHSAVDDLINSGLAPRDMLIASETGAFSGELEQHFPANGNAGAPPHILIRRNRFGKPAILGSAVAKAPGIARWIASGLSNAQLEYLRCGGALLVVSVRTADEERSYSETMLIHSVGNVQLHDL